jgi:hypothetical protein
MGLRCEVTYESGGPGNSVVLSLPGCLQDDNLTASPEAYLVTQYLSAKSKSVGYLLGDKGPSPPRPSDPSWPSNTWQVEAPVFHKSHLNSIEELREGRAHGLSPSSTAK